MTVCLLRLFSPRYGISEPLDRVLQEERQENLPRNPTIGGIPFFFTNLMHCFEAQFYIVSRQVDSFHVCLVILLYIVY